MTLLNINGKPYTSVNEDMALENLKKRLREAIASQISTAMRNSSNGTLTLNMLEFADLLEQAYYLGKENAVR